MNPSVSKVVLVVSTGVTICIVAYQPDWIGDQNGFLRDFINHEYLNILGVILAITLASLSQLHLSLGRLVDQLDREGLVEIRSEIKSSAVWLIVGFILGLVAIVVKPLIVFGSTGEAIVNGFCMLVLIFYILILTDITLSVFDIDFGGSDQDGP